MVTEKEKVTRLEKELKAKKKNAEQLKKELAALENELGDLQMEVGREWLKLLPVSRSEMKSY